MYLTDIYINAPDNYRVSRIGGGLSETQLHEITVVLIVFVILLMFFLHIRFTLPLLLSFSVLMPYGQVLMIGPAHLHVSRIMLVIAWVRVIGSGKVRLSKFKLNSIDYVLVLWAVSYSAAYVVLYQDSAALINRLGFLFNTFSVYFLVRLTYQGTEDLNRAIYALGVVCMVSAIFMINEQISGRNVFSVFGGVPEQALIRGDRIRSQGPFAHALLAGTCGAMLLPLFVGLRQSGASKVLATLSMLAATVMVITSASSTPILVYVVSLCCLCCWPFRRWMRPFRWTLMGVLIVLHLIMKAPVWSLIGRLDLTGSSSGYHRYRLIDLTINNFGDWWLCGMRDTSIWGWDMGDTANQFVEVAVTGGVFTLILFVALIGYAFQSIGRVRNASEHDPAVARQFWAMGVCLLANVVGFFGITYFDQTMIVWLLILALIASVSAADRRGQVGGLLKSKRVLL